MLSSLQTYFLELQKAVPKTYLSYCQNFSPYLKGFSILCGAEGYLLRNMVKYEIGVIFHAL